MSCFAQKKQLNAARDLIKSGKNLDKAEQSMSTLLKDSTYRQNKNIWLTLHNALVGQYMQGNEKLYLKQKYDTASLFNITKRLFETDEAFDSLFSKPEGKTGISTNKWRERHATFLHTIRPNLFNGGVYYVNKHKYQQAYDFFAHYLRCDSLPMFAQYQYSKTDTLRYTAAYWAMYSGYKLKDINKTLRYSTLAEKSRSMLSFVRQYEAATYLLQKDTARYVWALTSGFYNFPKFSYFFPRLVEYYSKKEAYDSALVIIRHALNYDSTDVVYRIALGTVLLNKGSYDECIDVCTRILADTDSVADAYYNIGLAYFNKAIELDKVDQKGRDNKKKIIQLYTQSLPFLERYRAFAPYEKKRWIAPLYTVYLNLNMGKQFDEIDKIRNEYTLQSQE